MACGATEQGRSGRHLVNVHSARAVVNESGLQRAARVSGMRGDVLPSLEQIEKQIHKLVNVLRVTELAPDEAVERELLLLKVSAGPDRRAELISTSEAFKGRVVDLGADSVTFELTGTPEELDAFQELARPHGIQELVRTGRVGIARASAKKQARRLSAIN